ncbi:MAG: hypothetical protein P4L46_03220 [Fimbriimonas sp.]|nr:hypothetical protein [Fimbriimonas sp.]
MLLLTSICVLLLRHQGAVAQDAITLKFQPTIGKAYPFKMTMDMTMNQPSGGDPITTKTEVNVDMKALSRTGDVTTMETKNSNAKVTIPPDSPMAAMKETMEKSMSDMVVESKIDTLYRIQSVKGTGGAGNAGMMSNFQSMAFPDHPVKVGDTWKSELDLGKIMNSMLGDNAQGMTMDGKIPLKFELKSLSQKYGLSIAEVGIVMGGDATMSVAGQNITMHMKGMGSYFIDIASGMTMSMKVASENEMEVGGMNISQKMTQLMEPRQP